MEDGAGHVEGGEAVSAEGVIVDAGVVQDGMGGSSVDEGSGGSGDGWGEGAVQEVKLAQDTEADELEIVCFWFLVF